MPAGWGYSYLDWIGAYGFALAHARRAATTASAPARGSGSTPRSARAGIFLTGAADARLVGQRPRLDAAIGNRSPYKPAAPHGAYRCARRGPLDRDRLLHRGGVAGAGAVAGRAEWLRATRASRRSRHRLRAPGRARRGGRRLDRDAGRATTAWRGCRRPACRPASARPPRTAATHDPQLRRSKWLTEVTGTKIGTWPVAELPVKLSAHAGLYRRPDRPRRAVLRRGQRLRPRRAARLFDGGDRGAGGRGRDLTGPSAAPVASRTAISSGGIAADLGQDGGGVRADAGRVAVDAQRAHRRAGTGSPSAARAADRPRSRRTIAGRVRPACPVPSSTGAAAMPTPLQGGNGRLRRAGRRPRPRARPAGPRRSGRSRGRSRQAVRGDAERDPVAVAGTHAFLQREGRLRHCRCGPAPVAAANASPIRKLVSSRCDRSRCAPAAAAPPVPARRSRPCRRRRSRSPGRAGSLRCRSAPAGPPA